MEEAFRFVKEYTGKLSGMFQEMYPEDTSISKLFDKYISKQAWQDIWDRAEIAAKRRLAELKNE